MPLHVFTLSLYKDWKFHYRYHREPISKQSLWNSSDHLIYEEWQHRFDNRRDPISHDRHYTQQFIRWLRSCGDPPTYDDYLDWNTQYFKVNAHKQPCYITLMPVTDFWRFCFVYPQDFTRRELEEMASEVYDAKDPDIETELYDEHEQDDNDSADEYILTYAVM